MPQIGKPQEMTSGGAVFQVALTWGALKKFETENKAQEAAAKKDGVEHSKLELAEGLVGSAIKAWKNEGADEWQDWSSEFMDDLTVEMLYDLFDKLTVGKEVALENSPAS